MNDNEEDHDSHEENDVFNILTAILSICLALFICAGNIAILLALKINWNLRTIPNMYIGSLAASDLSVGVLLLTQGLSSMPFSENILNEGEYFCLCFLSLLFVAIASSLISSLLVAIDRYIYIEHPLKYERLMTTRRSFFLILFSWVAALTYGTVPMYTSQFNSEDGCAPTHIFPKIYMIVIHPVFFFFICTVTTMLYLKLGKTISRHHKRVAPREETESTAVPRERLFLPANRNFVIHPDNAKTSAKIIPVGNTQQQDKPQNIVKSKHKPLSRRNRKVLKFLTLTFGVLFICWSPLVILGFLEYTIHVSHEILGIFSLLAVSNSVVNAVGLALLSTDFRQEFKKMLCILCRQCANKNDDSRRSGQNNTVVIISNTVE